MSQQDNSTRLARLEASFEFIKVLLQEIRDEVKGMPGREDYNKLEKRVKKLEDTQTSLMIKVGIGAGLLSILGTLAMKMFMG